MMDQGRTLTEIGDDLRSLNVDLFGAQMTSVVGLTGRALVERAYMNALGRSPTAAEADVWTSHLSAKRISADQFLAALSESVEHLATGRVYSGASVTNITLRGDGSSQTLRAGTASTVLLGFGGSDTLIGSGKADELHGGSGNDILRGGGGSDRYFWSPGDGNDRIEDGSTSAINGDELHLAVMPDAISLIRETIRTKHTEDGKTKYRYTPSNDLKIVIGGETITVVNHYKSAGLERLSLADGTVFSLMDLSRIFGTSTGDNLTGNNSPDSFSGLGGNDTIEGGRGSDRLYGDTGDDRLLGGEGDDLLTGGPGSDFLAGGAGSDTYIWARGDGSDTIDENGDTVSLWDSLILKDVRASELTVQRSGQAPSQTGGVNARDIVDFMVVGPGSDTMRAQGDGNYTIVWRSGDTPGSWHRVSPNELWGGTGGKPGKPGQAPSQTGGAKPGDFVGIAGGPGSDTGRDTFDENGDTAIVWDSLILKDIRSSEVTVQRSGQDALLVIAPSQTGGVNGGTLRLVNLGAAGDQGVDRVHLSDATWTRSDLQAMVLQAATTSGDDSIVGFSGRDVLSGGAGNDVLTGLGGNDLFVFKERFGSDRVTDFAAGPGLGDVIQLSLGAAFDSFEEVRAAARQVNADTVIHFGELGSITLQNVALTSLAADDFLFAA
jgi:Ca2+-binding RTX toxin-like protein